MKAAFRIALSVIGVLIFVNGSEAQCTDMWSWCEAFRDSCSSSRMQQNCKLTCGVCSDTPSPCDPLGCEFTCTVVGRRAVCTCPTGFQLNEDGRTCSDINECEQPDACANSENKICANTAGSFQCTTCLGTGRLNYYESETCCRQSDITGCGQNAATGVPSVPNGPHLVLGMWPWTVLIFVGGRPCTGTLISDDWVVASAHCFSGRTRGSRITVSLGLIGTSTNDTISETTEISASQVIIHENYNFPSNDIALLRLSTSVVRSWAVKPICLPNGEVPRPGARCYVSGYEALFYEYGVERVLNDQGMTVRPHSLCASNLGRLGQRIDESNMLCAEYDSSTMPECPGETGGPIVCQRCDSCSWYIAGLMTFGDLCPTTESYAVYTTIESYESWISQRTGLSVQKNGTCAQARASWRPWGSWSTCSVTCGGGLQQRNRICWNGQVDSSGCHGDGIQSQDCSMRTCPRWTEYDSWSACSQSCGHGEQTRMRSCLHGSVGQAGCDVGSNTERRPCYNNCPYWDSWTTWSECNATCGRNAGQVSTRRCINGEIGNGECIGDNNRFRACNQAPCSQWSSWSSWTRCSQSCGEGVRRSRRNCVYGNTCEGRDSRIESCFQQDCASWSDWSNWNECSVTCGMGRRYQRRECIGGRVGSVACPGRTREQQSCWAGSCPSSVDFTQWTPWTDCDCSVGQQYSWRSCRNPDGCSNDETGSSSTFRRRSCNSELCPRSYTKWSVCSVTCGGGVRNRNVVCAPGVANCVPVQETQECETEACLPRWSAWSQLTDCDQTCGGGTLILERHCISGTCIGDITSVQACATQPCPIATTASPCADHESLRYLVCPYVRTLCDTSITVRQHCRRTCQSC